MGRPRKRVKAARELAGERDRAEYDAAMDDALRDWSQVELAPPPRSPLERRGLRPTSLRRTEVDDKRFRGALDRDLRGFKDIAEFVGLDERNLRAAYKDDAYVRHYIRKWAGRYWADAMEVTLYLIPHLRLRRASAQRASARGQAREAGRFKKT